MNATQAAYIAWLHARTGTLRRLVERLPADDASAAARTVTVLENIAECAAMLAAGVSDRDRATAWLGLIAAVDGIRIRETTENGGEG